MQRNLCNIFIKSHIWQLPCVFLTLPRCKNNNLVYCKVLMIVNRQNFFLFVRECENGVSCTYIQFEHVNYGADKEFILTRDRLIGRVVLHTCFRLHILPLYIIPLLVFLLLSVNSSMTDGCLLNRDFNTNIQ